MAQFRCVCFTHPNPTEMLMFDDETMEYLVYQEEMSASGLYHLQGYCEFTQRVRLARAKEIVGGPTVHVEMRRGTQLEAAAYCKKQFNEDGSDKRIAHTEPYEEGTPRSQGKRIDLEAFKNDVIAGVRKRDLVEDHYGIIARYSKFYETLNSLHRPERSQEPVVTLLIGPTGLGKTRYVLDRYKGDDDFWISPLNNGTMWYDAYDGHGAVLLDDFAGKASHLHLTALLRLLDRNTIQVPTKGGHTWWMPNEMFVTTNILPRYWYTWGDRPEQYLALARRFHKVYMYHVPIHANDPGRVEQHRATWWFENAPPEVIDPIEVFQALLNNPH